MIIALSLALVAPVNAPLALVAPVNAPILLKVETLRCGAIDLRMASYPATGAGVTAPASQTLTRRVDAKQVRVELEPSVRVLVDGHRVQNRYVTSWACVAGRQRARYVVLGYACAIDPGYPHDCGGEKEWFRLLDRRGRFADAGVPHDGAARDRLNARLGIAAAMAAGVSMTALIE